MRRALAVGAAGALAALGGLLGALALGPACFPKTCDGDFVDYGVDGGAYLTSDTWESSSIDSDWLPFPAERTYVIHLDRWKNEGRQLTETIGYVSESPHPTCDGGCNFAEGTGNLLEFATSHDGVVWATNATCGSFYVRFVLHAGAPTLAYDASTPDASTSDASTDAPPTDATDASTPDASTDAPAE